MIDALRDHLRLNAAFNGCPALLCITGASGAGKTTAIAAIRERIDARLLPLIEFDSLGVPTDDEMTRCWESGRGWQKMMTYHWVYTTRHIFRMRPLVVLEGSFDPQYAIAACSAHRMKHHVVLLDVDALERKRIIEALDACGGNQTRAAQKLGISRGTLLSRLKQYGITRPRS